MSHTMSSNFFALGLGDGLGVINAPVACAMATGALITLRWDGRAFF